MATKRDMQHKKTALKITILLGLVAFAVISFLLSVSLGAYQLSIEDIVRAIMSETEDLNHRIFWNLRVPRTMVAALVGICLSVAGAILQGVMRNPLASPNIIGVSAGAGLMATICLVLLPRMSALLTPAAFVGAVLTTLLIYVLSWKNGVQPLRMVLAGIAISTLLSSFINLILIFYPERVHDTLGFKIGSLMSKTWHDFYLILPYALVGFTIAVITANRLNILMLGDEIAASLGLNVEVTRMSFIILASLLAASAVSVVGLLGFVGLIVPHMVRLIIGSDYKYLFPGSAILGAGLVMFCDTISRIIFAPMELPIGIIMSILGVPFFLFLLKGRLKIAKNS